MILYFFYLLTFTLINGNLKAYYVYFFIEKKNKNIASNLDKNLENDKKIIRILINKLKIFNNRFINGKYQKNAIVFYYNYL